MASSKGETSPYSPNKGGEIASPATDAIVTSLKEVSHKGGFPVTHNPHVGSFNKGAKSIETPATDIITRGGKSKR